VIGRKRKVARAVEPLKSSLPPLSPLIVPAIEYRPRSVEFLIDMLQRRRDDPDTASDQG
jgi:hypothetical protein